MNAHAKPAEEVAVSAPLRFTDLEADINELGYAACLASSVIGGFVEEGENAPHGLKIRLSDDEAGAVYLLLRDLVRRAGRLKERYYRAVEDDRSRERRLP